MRLMVILVGVVAAVLIISSIIFGFDLQTAFFTFVYLISFCAGFYFLYQFFYPNYTVSVVPKMWFYIAGGILFSFCFYPLLEFYSLKPDGYGWTDWAGINNKDFRMRLGFDQPAWFGMWYGKLGFSILCALIALFIQQIFDNDD